MAKNLLSGTSWTNTTLRLFHPLGAVRATVTLHSKTKLQLTGWSNHHNFQTPSNPILHNTSWLLSDISTLSATNMGQLKHSIEQGNITVVSDGSFYQQHQLGAAAWIIECNSTKLRVTGCCICPGNPMDQCSYRSELIGILGYIQHVNLLCHTYNIQQGIVHSGCDGKGAVMTCNITFDIIKTNRPHFDIIDSIHSAIKRSPVKWTFRRIKGHQDNCTPYSDLDQWSQLNIEADESNFNRPLYLPHSSNAILWTNRRGSQQLISSDLLTNLTQLIGQEHLRSYWKSKTKFSHSTELLIDWELCNRSHRSMEKYRHRWLSIWLTGFCGVGYMMALCKFQTHSNCPRCNQPNEKTQHILRCPDAGAQDLWAKCLRSLRQWIIDNKGPSDMADTIYHNLMAWQSHSPFPLLPTQPLTLRLATHQQDSLGWYSLMEGFLSSVWRQHLSDYFAQQKDRRSSLRWMTNLQNRIWRIPWEMWEHRNQILHSDATTIHQHEMAAVNNSIIHEWMRGIATLPSKYNHLFRGTLQSRLSDNHHYKRMWLTSVWLARETQGDLLALVTRDKTSSRFFDRWCASIGPYRRASQIPPAEVPSDSD